MCSGLSIDTEDGRDQISDSLREMCDVTEFPRTKVHHRVWKWKLKLVDGIHESHITGIIQIAIANEGFNNTKLMKTN